MSCRLFLLLDVGERGDARGRYGAVGLADEALENLARSDLDELLRTCGDHVLEGLSPADGGGELCYEVLLDGGGVGFGACRDVLVNWANGSREVGFLDGLSEFGARGFHERGVECAADGELYGALGTFLGEDLASFVDALDGAGDDELAWAVVVGGHDAVDGCANALDGSVIETYDGSHGGRRSLASFLHCHGALGDEFETVGEGHCASCYESGELAEGVACDHIGFEGVAENLSEDYGVEEDGRLCDLGLAELLVGAGEHDISDLEAEDGVGLVEESLSFGVVFIEVLAHADEL